MDPALKIGSDVLIDIKNLQALADDMDNFKVTKHMTKRFNERDIKLRFVQNTILYGEIIEQYPNDYPYPSCLVLYFLNGKTPIHVCVGYGEGKLWIITAYYPNTVEWEEDFKTRKAVN